LKTRIGGVPYGVGARLLTGLEREPGVEVCREIPSRLAHELRRGMLDAALVSSIEAFRRPGYRLVPGIGICSHGPVQSVRAFLRKGASTIRSAAVDEGSETSVALLRILLTQRFHTAPDCAFERIVPTTTPDDHRHDVVLLIGDCGLRAAPGRREVLDLGELWRAWTDLPFVYALWVVPPGADGARLTSLLAAAAARGAALPRSGDEGGVHYTIGPAEIAGLEQFRVEAAHAGLVEKGVRPEWLPRPGAAAAPERTAPLAAWRDDGA
jgi:chorismate dehydratase